jgi:hypothetical protein
VTKADRSRHDSKTLLETSPSQDLAIEVLVSGGNTLDASEAAGVARQTVSLWRNHHPGFRAKMNTRRTELLHERADRIRDLDAQAFAVVAQPVDDGDRSTALSWVKARHLHTVDVTEVGHTRAATIIDVHAEEIRKRPENAGSLRSLLDDTADRSSLTRQKSVNLAEDELSELLNDRRDG